jgi:hypothetical protein
MQWDINCVNVVQNKLFSQILREKVLPLKIFFTFNIKFNLSLNHLLFGTKTYNLYSNHI